MISIKNQYFNAIYNADTHTLVSLEIFKAKDNGVLDLNEFKQMDDVRIIGVGDTVIAPQSNSVNKLVLPKGVRAVRENAFYFLHADSLVWSDECSNIERKVFNRCSVASLENIGHVKNVAEYAFCSSHLQSLAWPSGCTVIKEGTFDNCEKFCRIDNIQAVETIGESAFSGCALTSFCIPPKCRHISDGTFSHCVSLKEIHGLEHVFSIGRSAFFECMIADVDLSRSICTTIGDYAFAKSAIKSFKPGYYLQDISRTAFDETSISR